MIPIELKFDMIDYVEHATTQAKIIETRRFRNIGWEYGWSCHFAYLFHFYRGALKAGRSSHEKAVRLSVCQTRGLW